MAKQAEVILPYSKLKHAIANILVAEGYLEGLEKVLEEAVVRSPRTSHRAAARGRTDLLRLVLKYDQSGQPALRHLERVSKPSRRIYVGKNEIPVVLSGLGIAILSTSRGIMTNRKAKTMNVGGELICRIY